MNRITLGLFSGITLSFSLSLSAQAEVPECAALKIECREDQAINDLKSCLLDKSNKVKRCNRALKSKLDTDKKRVLQLIDNKSAAVFSALDKDLGVLYSTLLRIDQINNENQIAITELTDRYSRFIKVYHDEFKPNLNSFEQSQITLNNKLSEIRKLNLEDRLQALMQLRHDMLESFIDIHASVGQTLFSLSVVRENVNFFSSKYLSDTGPYREYLAKKGLLGVLFSTDKTIEVLDNIDKHIVEWLNTSSDQHNRNLKIVEELIDGAIEQKAKALSDPILKEYYNSLSSVEFLDKAATKIREAFVESTKDTSPSGLPLMHRHYVSMKSFIEFAEICNINIMPTWMESGCKNIKRKESAAKQYLANITNDLKQNLGLLEEVAVSDSDNKISSAKEAITQGDLNLATELYDAILREVKL